PMHVSVKIYQHLPIHVQKSAYVRDNRVFIDVDPSLKAAIESAVRTDDGFQSRMSELGRLQGEEAGATKKLVDQARTPEDRLGLAMAYALHGHGDVFGGQKSPDQMPTGTSRMETFDERYNGL